jgi:hypothetical protein
LPRKILPKQLKVYWGRRDAGYSMRDSAAAAGFSLTKARELEGNRKREQNDVAHLPEAVRERVETEWGEPRRYEELKDEAKRAWDDFGYFQRRYFGRVPVPWQIEAAELVIGLLESEDEEYVVINAPPGSGKTLLFTHDIPAWITVRNRAIRGQLGSVTGPLAERYTNRLRRTFERVLPEKGISKDVQSGHAYDALSTLAADFGRFKPLEREVWTASGFVVAQYSDQGAVTEKEMTWQSYGVDQGFIGGRYDFVAWDDLVDPRKQRTPEARAQLREDYDTLCETRLEPSGVLILQGQRILSDDLYRYCIDKKVPIELEDGSVEERPKYHFLKFPAHYDDFCQADHFPKSAKPYPEGCLLSPNRLPWQKLIGLKANNANRFQVTYQQEDMDPESVLVRPEWINGSMEYPGCLDQDRDRLEIPEGLSQPLFSAASVDPSPTKFWGIEWWVYHKPSEQRFLIDLLKKQMEAPAFLDWNANTQTWSGIMDEWQKTSIELGVPITHWIIETNVAQRFLLQYDHVRRWCAKYGVTIVPHTTSRNKSDPEFGVHTIAPNYQYGRSRLPFKAHSYGRAISLQLIKELTNYVVGSDIRTNTDLVMSNWFWEFQLERLFFGEHVPSVQPRPSWVKDPKGWLSGRR